MPAIVNRTEGSCGIRLAEGTMVWPLSAKKRVKAARSPLASIHAAYRGQKRIRGRSGGRKGPGGGRGGSRLAEASPERVPSGLEPGQAVKRVGPGRRSGRRHPHDRLVQ